MWNSQIRLPNIPKIFFVQIQLDAPPLSPTPGSALQYATSVEVGALTWLGLKLGSFHLSVHSKWCIGNTHF